MNEMELASAVDTEDETEIVHTICPYDLNWSFCGVEVVEGDDFVDDCTPEEECVVCLELATPTACTVFTICICNIDRGN